jgi:2-aminoadipate transaminase
VRQDVLARRAAGLSTAFPAPHFPTELGEGVIAFDSGFAFPHLFPDLVGVATEALTTHRADTLQYSTPQGEPQLREWIAGYMRADGCDVAAENILIVNGAKHGIDLVCRLLLDEGDSVVVTAPTYFTVIPILKSFGAELFEVGQDAEGISISELMSLFDRLKAEGRPLPKFVYNVSDFHNPSGVTMSRARREALIRLCADEGVYVVEDNPYRRVRFEGEEIPTLKALDHDDAVIHVATFSKLIAPGLRMGWVAAHAHLIARMMQLKSDGGSNPLIQQIVYDFCRSDAFEAHATRVQDTYREHRDRMVAAFARELPEARIDVAHGGYYVWATLPAGVDGDALAKKAAEDGVNIIPGSKFFAGQGGYPQNTRPGRDHIRLSYSYATLDQIDEGVRRLGQAYRALQA